MVDESYVKIAVATAKNAGLEIREEDWEDVAQELRIRVYREQKATGERMGLPWYVRVCRNLAVDQIKWEANGNGERRVRAMVEQAESKLDQQGAGILEAMRLFDALSPDYQTALALNYVGCQAKQAARYLGISPTAYKSRLARARNAAKKLQGDPFRPFSSSE